MREVRKIIVAAGAALAALVASSCSFFGAANESLNPNWEAKVTSITLSERSVSIEGGEPKYVSLSINPKDVTPYVRPRWSYEFTDGSSDAFSVDGTASGCMVSGRRVGKGWVKCELNNITAMFTVNVNSDDPGVVNGEHYIYSNDQGVVSLECQQTSTVSVNLFNGSSTDMEDFRWSVKDPNVAKIAWARNNCVITGREAGSTQITVSHPKAEYDFTFVVFCYTDPTKATPYITTRSNVISLNKRTGMSRTVTFNIENDTSYGAANNRFWYEDTTASGPGSVVTITNNTSQYLEIQAKPNINGQAKITVHNDICAYSLDIIVVVSNIVDNVYITTSESTVLIDDDSPRTIYAYLNGMDAPVDTDGFQWSIEPVKSAMPGWTEYTKIESFLDFAPSGDVCQITGKKNGVFRVTVSHTASATKRSVVVMLTKQLGSAVDASMYITTSQNYVQTKVKGEGVKINVTLVGGIPGDEGEFVWTVSSDDAPAEKTALDMITCETLGSGTVKSRSALTSGTDAYGTLLITPNIEGYTGTVKIEVSHPKCLYTTEIMVKIFSEWELLEDPVYITVTDDKDNEVSIIKSLYKDLDMKLKARLDGSDDTAGTEWEITEGTPKNLIRLSADTGSEVFVQAGGSTEAGTTYVSASHTKALNSKKVLFLTANSQQELDSLKGVYADNTYFRLSEDPTAIAEHTAEIVLRSFGIKLDDVKNKNKIKFEPENSAVASVEFKSAEITDVNDIRATITGNKAGKTKIEAWYEDNGIQSAHVVFDVVVLPTGESIGVNEAKYLTTNLNAVVIPEVGKQADVEVTGVGIKPAKMQDTAWDFKPLPDDSTPPVMKPVTDVVSIAANGAKATLTALAKGKTTLTVSNPESINTIDIQAKVGDLYEWTDGMFCYITTDGQDTYQLLAGQDLTIGAALVNNSDGAGGTWNWTAKAPDGGETGIISITKGASSGPNSTCLIQAKEAGQAYIVIENNLSVAEKEILIVVGNTEADLEGLAYISTKQNVVTVGEKSNVSVQVNVQNTSRNIVSGFVWSSRDPTVVDVVASGTTAVFYGKKQGTTVITVSNAENGIQYPLEIIANCVDPENARQNPYISCENIVSMAKNDSPYQLSADLIGGDPGDEMGFRWSTSDNGRVIRINSSNNVCQITPVEKGVAQISITHSKALGAARTVLVIVNDANLADCEIVTSQSQIHTLQPDGSNLTLQVSLEGGSSSDARNFSWWASDYTVAELKANEGSCIVIPKVPGYIEIYVSHPKARYTKTFQITVTKATTFDFAYPSEVITLTAGQPTMITMNVPTLNADAQYVTYKSMQPDFVDFGICSSTICQLNPLKPNGNTPVVIIATLWAYRNGVPEEAGTVKRYVHISEAPAINNYVRLTTGASIITTDFDRNNMSNTKSIALSAEVCSDNRDTQQDMKDRKLEEKLVWTITPVQGSKVAFNATPQNKTGKSLVLTPTASGVAQVTINVPESEYYESQYGSKITPKTVYIVVNGTERATIDLPSQISVQERGGSQVVTANINGGGADAYDRLKWELYEDEELTQKHTSGDIATMSGTGASVNIKGHEKGTVYLLASVSTVDPADPANEILEQKVCKVNVIEKPGIIFDYPVITMQPETHYDIPYTVYPAGDEIYAIESTNPVLRIDWDPVKGHGDIPQKDEHGNIKTDANGNTLWATWYDKTTGRGNLRVITKNTTGGRDITANVIATARESRVEGSFTAQVGYKYLFSFDKTYVTTQPEKTYPGTALSDNEEVRNTNPFRLKFNVRPATCTIRIEWNAGEKDYGSKHLYIDTDPSRISGYKIDYKEETVGGTTKRIAEITPDGTQTDIASGIATGTVVFYTKDGQVNTTARFSENGSSLTNKVVYSVSNKKHDDQGTSENILKNSSGYGELKLKSFYTSLQLLMMKETSEDDPNVIETKTVNGRTVYYAQGVTSTSLGGPEGSAGVHSYWDARINSLVIGDGEVLDWTWGTPKDEYIDHPEIMGLEWTPLGGESASGETGMQNSVNFGGKPDKQGLRIKIPKENGKNMLTRLSHTFDYGWNLIQSNTTGAAEEIKLNYPQVLDTYNWMSIAGLKSDENTARIREDLSTDPTVRYTSQAGVLKVKYFDYSSDNGEKEYSIKVFCNVRNTRRDVPDPDTQGQ